jgi:hypothetical protein
MNMDLLKVRDFEVLVENILYEVTLTEIGSTGELIFAPKHKLDRGNYLSTECRVSFHWNEKNFNFKGEFFMPVVGRIIIVPKSEVLEDIRSQVRVKIDELPCTISKKGFLEHTVMHGVIMDLSERGALIRTDQVLELGTVYQLDAQFGRAKFQTMFLIRKEKQEEDLRYYGVLFEETTEENTTLLKMYLKMAAAEVLGVERADERVEKANIDKFWRGLKH